MSSKQIRQSRALRLEEIFFHQFVEIEVVEIHEDSDFTPSPEISHLGGDGKKIFGPNAPTSSPQTLDQVFANDQLECYCL